MTTDVHVRLYASAAAAAGVQELIVRAGSVAELRAALAPSVGQVLERCSLLINGIAAKPEQLLLPGATVDVLPPFAGG